VLKGRHFYCVRMILETALEQSNIARATGLQEVSGNHINNDFLLITTLI
jgi:hypothetical protein